MARITVEDCLVNVENRFDLVLKAAERAHAIEMGAEPKVSVDNDKPTVIALREIADGLLLKEAQKSATEVAAEMFDMEEVVVANDDDDMEGMTAQDTTASNDPVDKED